MLERFGAHGMPEPLPGGRGRSWRVGDVVLKPLDTSLANLEWQATTVAALAIDGVRLSTPRRALDGALIVERWTAWPYLAGADPVDRWGEVLAAGERLHDATAILARPAFLGRRRDRWAVADRVAWGERPVDGYGSVPHVRRLLEHAEPVGGRSQVIHGDLTRNVLLADGLPPAVIDVSPYWRPRGFASAIVIADALAWEGADESIVERVAGVGAFPQLLVRALVFRIVAETAGATFSAAVVDEAYRGPVDLACRLVEAR